MQSYQDAYIFETLRTPIGKGSKSGALSSIHPFHLLSQLYSALEQRTGLDSSAIESIILGCAAQVSEQGANIAKISTLYHGWGHHIDGTTINSFCASGLTSIGMAVAKVQSGANQMILAGGIEMLSRVPMFSDQGAWFNDPMISEGSDFTHMGVSADLIANLEAFDREQLDDYALQSHARALNACQQGYFQPSIVAVTDEQGHVVLERDECIRPNLNQQRISQLQPMFADYLTVSIQQKIQQRYPAISSLKHIHHLGNSPMLADGASIVLVGNLQHGKTLGLKPKAKVKSFTSCSCEPIIMLLGGQQAMEGAIKQAGLGVDDIDVHYFAEAFSATCLKYQRDLNVDSDKLALLRFNEVNYRKLTVFQE